MSMPPKDTTLTAPGKGRLAENQAAAYLTARGLAILARNYRVKGGELDLVAMDGPTLVFVEVRLRSRMDFGGPEASVTGAKRRRLSLAARHWLAGPGARHRGPCRFDCLLLRRVDDPAPEWLRHAFDEEGRE